MAWPRRLFIAVAAAAPLAAGANDFGGVDCTDLRGLPVTARVDWQTQVKPLFDEFFPTGRCTSCHNPGQFDGQLDLTSQDIDAIYKLVPPGYVVPGDPQASLLFDKVNCDDPGSGGLRMPFLQNPLTPDQQALVFDWIAQGALGDIEGEPPIPRTFLFRDGAESLRWY